MKNMNKPPFQAESFKLLSNVLYFLSLQLAYYPLLSYLHSSGAFLAEALHWPLLWFPCPALIPGLC